MSRVEAVGESIAVLCVDDDEPFVTMLETFLEREEEAFDVRTATSPTVGLDHLTDNEIDCVVSDYDMPRTDGLEFLRMVRSMHADLPFILFTGKGGEEIASEAVSAGVTDYLQKSAGTEQYETLADRITAAVSRQQAEVTLQRAAKEQSTVIESINDAVYRVDSRGRFVAINEAFVEMSGYDREELLGAEVSILKDEETVEHFENAIVSMLKGDEEETTVTFEMQTANGGRLPCEDSLSLLPHGEGEYNGAVGTIRDLSNRTRRVARLEEERERLDEFASMVSHDLRSPLSVARGWVRLAREEHETDHLEDAEVALERMNTLIDDLLTLARQEVSESELADVSIRAVARSAQRMIDEDVTLCFDGDPGSIEANESRLQELFENLLLNTAEHAGPDATARIGRLGSENGFYFEDDGPGIPPEDRDAVFEHGFTNHSGTGLGLTIVSRIVGAHDWTLALEESDAGGARFEISEK